MNIFKNRPLCLATVFFVLTGFSCFMLSFAVKIALGLLFLIAAVTLFIVLFKKRRALSPSLLLLLCAVQCFLSCYVCDITLSRASYLNDNKAHRSVAYVTEVLEEGDDTYLYAIRLQSADGEPCSLSFSMNSDTSLEPGDLFSAELMFSTYSPDNVLANSYNYTHNRVGYAYPTSSVQVEGCKRTPLIFATRCRSYLCDFLDDIFSRDAAMTLRAMLLGDRSGLDTETNLSFRRAGITHLLALSGMHISLLSLAVLRILKLLCVPNHPRIFITILFVLLYSMLVGLPLSILRAAGMTMVLLLGGLIRRERDSVTSLSASVLIILLISPRAIIDIGFWLSVTATLGILLALEYRIGYIKKQGFFFRLLRIFVSSLVMTVSASLFTLPIVTFIFGEISLLSIPANLIFPAMMNYIIYLGLAAIPLPFLRPLVNLITEGYLWLLSRVTSMNGIMLSLRHTLFYALLVFIILFVIILLVCKLSRPRRMLIPIGILSLAALISLVVPYTISRSESIVSYRVVGDGDSILVKNQGHHLLYISANASKSLFLPLYYQLADNDVYELDLVCFSHYHHGMDDLLTEVAVTHVIHEIAVPPAYTSIEREMYKDLEKRCASLNISVRMFPYGETLTVGDTTLTALPRSLTDDDDHAATAAVFTVADRSIYYASSAYYQEQQQNMIKDVLTPLTCDTLIFGCHGVKKGEPTYPDIYPLDMYVKLILYAKQDGYMRGTEEERRLYEQIHILRTDCHEFSCKQ